MVHIQRTNSPIRFPHNTIHFSHHIPRPPRLTIIAGNSASVTIQTVNDHAPKAYYSRSTRTSHKSQSNSPLTQPSQLSQLPYNRMATYFPLIQPTSTRLTTTSPSHPLHECSPTSLQASSPVPEHWYQIPRTSRSSPHTHNISSQPLKPTSPTAPAPTPSTTQLPSPSTNR